jgi:hypothetical protein
MTDYLSFWANRHDEECEDQWLTPPDSGNCHCYRRWLEGRLGEMTSSLKAVTEHYISLIDSGDCGSWDARDEDVIKTALALLPPKGATGGGSSGDDEDEDLPSLRWR